eukprot:scaffold3715_cov37-Tisochrysis_lutea.AAC.8
MADTTHKEYTNSGNELRAAVPSQLVMRKDGPTAPCCAITPGGHSASRVLRGKSPRGEIRGARPPHLRRA